MRALEQQHREYGNYERLLRISPWCRQEAIFLANYFAIWHNSTMSIFAKVAKALSDEGRVRIIRALDNERELCACQLTELLGLTPSTVSKHLRILKQACLLTSRKEGTWVFYAINTKAADNLVREWIKFVGEAVRNEPEYREDKRKLKKIKKLNPEYLCFQQRCRK